MKTIRKHLSGLAIIGGLIAFLNFAHAQTTAKSVLSVSATSVSDMDVMLQAVEETTPQAAESVPMSGTFYSAQFPNWPPLPCNMNNVPVWNLGGGVFLLSDLDVNYSQPPPASSMMAGGMSAMDAPWPDDGGGDGGTNSYTSNGSSFVLPDYGTNLWIAQFGISSGNLVGVVSNSSADISYEIQSLTDLTQAGAGWNSEGFILGSETVNWTPLSVAQNGRMNLFLRIRSWIDSDGVGIPDWWQLQYFGYVGVDPNALDLADDGWTVYQKFQMGLNPNLFYTPPAPQGLTATFNADSTATVNWLPSPGLVTGYTVQRKYYIYSGVQGGVYSQTFNPSASSNSLHDSTPFTTPYAIDYYGLTIRVSYQIQAHYAGGDSAWSDLVWLEPGSSAITLVPGSQGSVYLAAPNLPAGTTALRLTRVDEWMETEFGDSLANAVSFNIPVSTGTNELYLIPAEWTTTPTDAYGYAFYNWFGQPVDVNGNGTSQATELSWRFSYSGGQFFYGYYSKVTGGNIDWIVPPYFDGRAQLKQNLIFLLRAAPVDYPFYYYGLTRDQFGDYEYAYTMTNPTTYAYSGFNSPVLGTDDIVYNDFDVFSPFQNNYAYLNFVYNLANVDSGGRITTGAGGSYAGEFTANEHGLVLQNPPTYQFSPPTTSGTTISAVLATNQTQWLCSYPLDSPEMYYDPATHSMVSYGYLEEIGVTPSIETDWSTYYNTFETMASYARNVYGLPFLSAEIAWGSTSDSTFTLSAGRQVENVDGYFYPQTVQPLFQTVEYDFWNQSPLPGTSNFSTSQTSDLLMVGVDSSISINGYAKLAVNNGYPSVYAYLGQYFDQAYQIDTNGIVTTNTTGVLSPYGQYFATQPGPAALVTMPDIDPPYQRGICTVYCVSLVLDKNHDGNMDLSFNGPDATSPNSPFVFWANNNYDRWATNQSPLAGYFYTDIEQDDQPIAFSPAAPITPTPDCNYSNRLANGYSYRAIPCTRDLEDFARLWVCGITTNLLAALPSGSTVTLNWNDVGNPNPGNPTIDLFAAADADGGIGYLTNETVTTMQTNIFQCPYIGRLGPGGSIQLNAIQFANGWAGNHFIWCGVSNGTGGLNLTITDGNGNVLAQSTAFIQIVDIKQMYERWTVGDNPTNAPVAVPYLVSDNSPAGMLTFQYTWPTDTNTTYILHVHGFNLETWAKDRFAETEFKRLYWQGYQGRFGLFRWPTTFTPYVRTFDDSESNAWASAKGLLNLLTNLNAEYPGQVYMTAHSHGAVVAGEALRQATQQGLGQIVNTYVAMQGAVAAHAYDPTTPIRSLGIWDSGTPNRYAYYYTDSSPCYFNGSAGAGTYVNFFNTNDYAFSASIWQRDQNLKPDSGYGYNPVPGFFYRGDETTVLTFPTNTYELFSYCDEARCYALGAQVNVGGAFENGTNYNEVSLPSVWPPDPLNGNYGAHIWHSAEFRSDNAQRWLFWDEVLFQMGLKKNL